MVSGFSVPVTKSVSVHPRRKKIGRNLIRLRSRFIFILTFLSFHVYQRASHSPIPTARMVSRQTRNRISNKRRAINGFIFHQIKLARDGHR